MAELVGAEEVSFHVFEIECLVHNQNKCLHRMWINIGNCGCNNRNADRTERRQEALNSDGLRGTSKYNRVTTNTTCISM